MGVLGLTAIDQDRILSSCYNETYYFRTKQVVDCNVSTVAQPDVRSVVPGRNWATDAHESQMALMWAWGIVALAQYRVRF